VASTPLSGALVNRACASLYLTHQTTAFLT
jgi:hypothetical protein